MLSSVIRAVVGAAVRLFYRLERRGAAVATGPVLLAANHPNSLLDPIIVLATAGRRSRPLAKAPLFERAVVGRLIRALGGIPVYRREDDPAKMERNEDAFRAATAALLAGDAVQIFPEGRSHSDPSMSPLRTGAARIALQAESESSWRLGLVIVPVGLTYERKRFFRGRAVVVYGDPMAVSGWRAAWERDSRDAARQLTAALDLRLRALTLNLSESEDTALIDTAERVWSHAKGVITVRERASLGERLPRLRAFAEGLAWLRAVDPARHRRLAGDVRRYRRVADLLGAAEGDVPDRYRLGPSLRWVATLGLPVLLLSPVAVLAVAFWWVPYRLVRRVVAGMKLPDDMEATYKLATSFLAYPSFLGLWTGLAWWWGGWPAGLLALLLLPAVGVAAVAWLDRAREARADVRLFLRLGRHAQRAGELAARRARLVSEFDAVQALRAADDVSSSSPSLRRTR